VSRDMPLDRVLEVGNPGRKTDAACPLRRPPPSYRRRRPWLAVAPAHANRCTGAKLNAIGKKESGLLTCRAKVAAKNDTSGLSACETKVT